MKNFKITPLQAVGLVVVAFILLVLGLYKAFVQPPEQTDTKALASEIQASIPKNVPSMPAGVNPTKGAVGMGRRIGAAGGTAPPRAQAPAAPSGGAGSSAM